MERTHFLVTQKMDKKMRKKYDFKLYLQSKNVLICQKLQSPGKLTRGLSSDTLFACSFVCVLNTDLSVGLGFTFVRQTKVKH